MFLQYILASCRAAFAQKPRGMETQNEHFTPIPTEQASGWAQISPRLTKFRPDRITP